MSTAEPLVIVGAGLAGSAAAALLARAGRPAQVLERARQVRPRLCGEFISAEAARALAGLGVDVLGLGGQPTRGLRLLCGRTVIEAELPFEAVGLTRRTLDGALQQQAERAGACLRRGQRVVVRQVGDLERPFVLELLGDAGNGLGSVSDTPAASPDVKRAGAVRHTRITTPTLMLACGKTDLPPLARRPQREPERLLGLQTHLVLAPAQAQALQGHVEVLLFDGGYAGLQPVEGGFVNLCLLAQQASARGGLKNLMQRLQRDCPLLAERLAGARWPAAPPQAIFRVPYGHLHRPAARDPPRLWRLGDQAAVIASFTGDGMAIALHSAALAVDELLAGGSAAAYHARLRHDVGAQMARAQALYSLGRWRAGRTALLALLRNWPALLVFIATMTRVPATALRW